MRLETKGHNQNIGGQFKSEPATGRGRRRPSGPGSPMAYESGPPQLNAHLRHKRYIAVNIELKLDTFLARINHLFARPGILTSSRRYAQVTLAALRRWKSANNPLSYRHRPIPRLASFHVRQRILFRLRQSHELAGWAVRNGRA